MAQKPTPRGGPDSANLFARHPALVLPLPTRARPPRPRSRAYSIPSNAPCLTPPAHQHSILHDHPLFCPAQDPLFEAPSAITTDMSPPMYDRIESNTQLFHIRLPPLPLIHHCCLASGDPTAAENPWELEIKSTAFAFALARRGRSQDSVRAVGYKECKTETAAGIAPYSTPPAYTSGRAHSLGRQATPGRRVPCYARGFLGALLATPITPSLRPVQVAALRRALSPTNPLAPDDHLHAIAPLV
ncbi:hypothetical protein VTO73DRAFT_5961 [Trametes versicolor]